jgi:hypothetical protein
LNILIYVGEKNFETDPKRGLDQLVARLEKNQPYTKQDLKYAWQVDDLAQVGVSCRNAQVLLRLVPAFKLGPDL